MVWERGVLAQTRIMCASASFPCLSAPGMEQKIKVQTQARRARTRPVSGVNVPFDLPITVVIRNEDIPLLDDIECSHCGDDAVKGISSPVR